MTKHIDWTKSKKLVGAKLAAIRAKLRAMAPVHWPNQKIDPERWGIFLMDVVGSRSSVFMMKYGAVIPLKDRPHLNNPELFPVMKKWQQAAALEVVHKYVKEENVLGAFPGNTSMPYNWEATFLLPIFRGTEVITRQFSVDTKRLLQQARTRY